MNQGQYEAAEAAGRAPASGQLEQGGSMETRTDLADMVPEDTAAYVALQTGRLRSLVLDPATHEADVDMGEGFQTASTRSSRKGKPARRRRAGRAGAGSHR